MIKNYLKNYLLLFSIAIILTLILSIINYFFNIPITPLKVIIITISILIPSIILGKESKEKAYLEGLNFSSVYLILVTIFKLIINSPFNYKTFIIYFLLLFTSIIGSMIGINIKKG